MQMANETAPDTELHEFVEDWPKSSLKSIQSIAKMLSAYELDRSDDESSDASGESQFSLQRKVGRPRLSRGKSG